MNISEEIFRSLENSEIKLCWRGLYKINMKNSDEKWAQ
jgi:hypothetical protein